MSSLINAIANQVAVCLRFLEGLDYLKNDQLICLGTLLAPVVPTPELLEAVFNNNALFHVVMDVTYLDNDQIDLCITWGKIENTPHRVIINYRQGKTQATYGRCHNRPQRLIQKDWDYKITQVVAA